MADNKFKNAAAKLLAQHSIKQDEKFIYDPPVSRPDIPPAIEPRPERPPMDPMPFVPEKNYGIPISKPIVLPPNKPSKQDAINADMVTALIRIIIVLVSVLLGWAIAAFIVPESILGGINKIALGIFAGTILGLIIAKQF